MNNESTENHSVNKPNVFDNFTYTADLQEKNKCHIENHIKYINKILILLTEYYDSVYQIDYSLDDPNNACIKKSVIMLCNNNNMVTDILKKISIRDNKVSVGIQNLLGWLGDISIITYVINTSIDAMKILNTHNTKLLPKYNKIVLLNKKEINNFQNHKYAIHKEICKKIIHNIKVTQKDNTIQNENVTEILNKLSDSIMGNFLLYDSYTYVISILIDYFKKNNMHYLIDLIIANVEILKNAIINSEIKYDNIKSKKDFAIDIMPDTKVKTSLCSTNPFIKTFGLSVSSKYDNLQNTILTVFKRNPPKKKVKKEADLSQIASELNHVYVFIVITKSIMSPIEFDIWKLYDKTESRDFKQEKNSGVNKLFIDKFNTIKFVDKNKKWKHNIKLYGDFTDNSEKFIILEKLNNDKYRILKKYNTNQVLNKNSNLYIDHMKCDNNPNFINDKYNISGLLSFISNKTLLKKSDRINQYNNNMEKKILKNMFLEHSVDVAEFNENAKIIDISLLKYNLIHEVNDEIDKLLKSKYKKIQKKKDIIDLLHEECIISTFSQFLINQYLTYISERFKNYKNVSKLYYINDILKTFMSQLLLLKISLGKKIHDEYLNKEEILDDLISTNSDGYDNLNNVTPIPGVDLKSVNINPSTSDNVNAELTTTKKIKLNPINHEIIKNFLDDLFIGIIDLIITENDNIYMSLIYKTKLLELSLY